MPKPDAGNARARMNRAQRRKMPKILAAKVGGKKKLAAMLEEAKARARAEDEAKRKEQSGRDGSPEKMQDMRYPSGHPMRSMGGAHGDTERAGHGVENPNMLRGRDVTLSIGGKEVSGPPAHFSSESDFDADGDA